MKNPNKAILSLVSMIEKLSKDPTLNKEEFQWWLNTVAEPAYQDIYHSSNNLEKFTKQNLLRCIALNARYGFIDREAFGVELEIK